MTIDVQIKNKMACLASPAIIVCGNSDYVIKFNFDVEWADYQTKTARFSFGAEYIDVIFDGDEVSAPVLKNTTAVSVGVYAGDIRTTTAAVIPCLPSITSADGVPADPPESVYDQLMQRMAELESPDWSQNDAAKKDYIKNRTHWIDDDGTVHKIDAKFLPAGGGDGTDDHQQLINRDATDAHPMKSITGLNDALTKLKPLIVSVVYINDNTYTADKTFAQILVAYNVGQQISAEIVNYPDIQSPITLTLTMHNGSLFVFSGTITDGNGHKVVSAYVHDTDVWDVTLDTLTDGKDGITPHIGDNGNWYLGTTDTGKPSRGAKGDKGDTGPAGKDGAGMDVTGATVGQIAKISAVDDNGVPTAWEPVNMPMNGGEAGKSFSLAYEAEFTLEAGVEQYTEDVTENFNNFSEMLVLLSRGKTPTTESQAIVKIDGITISDFSGKSVKATNVNEIFYLRRVLAQTFFRIYRKSSNPFSWNGSDPTLGVSCFDTCVGSPTGKFSYWRSNSVDAQACTIRIFVR